RSQEVLVEAHRDAEAHLALAGWRDLHEHDVGADRARSRDDTMEVAEPDRHVADLTRGKQRPQARRRLPSHVLEVRAEAAIEKAIVSERQAGVDRQIAKPLDLVAERPIELDEIDGAVREDRHRAVGNDAYRLARRDLLHVGVFPKSRFWCLRSES